MLASPLKIISYTGLGFSYNVVLVCKRVCIDPNLIMAFLYHRRKSEIDRWRDRGRKRERESEDRTEIGMDTALHEGLVAWRDKQTDKE